VKDLRRCLQAALSGRAVLLGVGNRMRGDDAAGSLLADRLASRIPVMVVDGGSAPENVVEHIASHRPDTVVLLDAVDFGGKPGEVRFFDGASVGAGGLSTHALSLEAVAEYLRSRGGTRVCMLGIQPARVALGEGLSPEVADSLTRLADALADVCAAEARGGRPAGRGAVEAPRRHRWVPEPAGGFRSR
jgi:hydrogenase 3 maturation protease